MKESSAKWFTTSLWPYFYYDKVTLLVISPGWGFMTFAHIKNDAMIYMLSVQLNIIFCSWWYGNLWADVKSWKSIEKNLEKLLHIDSECTIIFTCLCANRIFNNIKLTCQNNFNSSVI